MKLYVVYKYVKANSVAEALRKSKTTPIHEVALHQGWFDKNRNYEFFDASSPNTGFKKT